MIDIEKIARQIGVIDHIDCSDDLFVPARVDVEDILAFGEAVREACAKMCDEYLWYEDGDRSPDESNAGCADAIRARGQS